MTASGMYTHVHLHAYTTSQTQTKEEKVKERMNEKRKKGRLTNGMEGWKEGGRKGGGGRKGREGGKTAGRAHSPPQHLGDPKAAPDALYRSLSFSFSPPLLSVLLAAYSTSGLILSCRCDSFKQTLHLPPPSC